MKRFLFLMRREIASFAFVMFTSLIFITFTLSKTQIDYNLIIFFTGSWLLLLAGFLICLITSKDEMKFRRIFLPTCFIDIIIIMCLFYVLNLNDTKLKEQYFNYLIYAPGIIFFIKIMIIAIYIIKKNPFKYKQFHENVGYKKRYFNKKFRQNN